MNQPTHTRERQSFFAILNPFRCARKWSWAKPGSARWGSTGSISLDGGKSSGLGACRAIVRIDLARRPSRRIRSLPRPVPRSDSRKNLRTPFGSVGCAITLDDVTLTLVTRIVLIPVVSGESPADMAGRNGLLKVRRSNRRRLAPARVAGFAWLSRRLAASSRLPATCR